jgi:hypothetical protein
MSLIYHRPKKYTMFYVSCLKRAIGKQIIPIEEFPPLDEEEQLVLVLGGRLLEVQEMKLRNRSMKEYLIKWKNLPIWDATWEGEQMI